MVSGRIFHIYIPMVQGQGGTWLPCAKNLMRLKVNGSSNHVPSQLWPHWKLGISQHVFMLWNSFNLILLFWTQCFSLTEGSSSSPFGSTEDSSGSIQRAAQILGSPSVAPKMLQAQLRELPRSWVHPRLHQRVFVLNLESCLELLGGLRFDRRHLTPIKNVHFSTCFGQI